MFFIVSFYRVKVWWQSSKVQMNFDLRGQIFGLRFQLGFAGAKNRGTAEYERNKSQFDSFWFGSNGRIVIGQKVPLLVSRCDKTCAARPASDGPPLWAAAAAPFHHVSAPPCPEQLGVHQAECTWFEWVIVDRDFSDVLFFIFYFFWSPLVSFVSACDGDRGACHESMLPFQWWNHSNHPLAGGFECRKSGRGGGCPTLLRVKIYGCLSF